MANSAHVPVRQCAGCRARRPQNELARFVRTARGWSGPQTQPRPAGRGTYLCSHECVARVMKNKKYPGLASAAAEYGFNRGSTMAIMTDV